MGNLPFISVIPWELIMQWANLLILVLLIKKFLLKPVRAVLDKRNAQVTKIYDEAGVLKAEADNARIQYETKLKGAKDEADSMIKNATEKAQIRSEQIVQEAERQAAGTLKKTQLQLEQEKKQAILEIKGEISAMAVDIAQKVVEREITENDHKELIDSFIGSVGDGK